MNAHEPRPPALQLIIAYKLVRAALSLIGAVLVATARHSGLAAWLDEHAVSKLSVHLSSQLASALEPKHLWVAVIALCGDAAVLLLEAWALRRGHAWGSWLVVAATGALLPFELVALAHRVSLPRLALLIVNALIVGYLVWVRLRRVSAVERQFWAEGTSVPRAK